MKPKLCIPPLDVSMSKRPSQAPRGRGARSNPDPRFDSVTRELVDDGWGSLDEAPPLRTHLAIDTSRTVITYNKSPDVGFDRSINPYRGCEHGCVYCFARPSHAYLGLSPGLDFESRLFYKPDAAAQLRRELASPSYRCAPIAVGINTDGYQPIERELKITRAVLEVLHECRHPLFIVTKSMLVERDVDLLAPMAEQGLAQVSVSITTLRHEIARRLEPRDGAAAARGDHPSFERGGHTGGRDGRADDTGADRFGTRGYFGRRARGRRAKRGLCAAAAAARGEGFVPRVVG